MTTVRRVPLLSGSRIVHVPLGDDDVVLRPPPPPTRVVDVEGAVRDALRFPLDGAPLADLAREACARDRRRGAARAPTSRSAGGPAARGARHGPRRARVARHPRRTADAPRRGRALAEARPPRPRAPPATAASARISRARRRPRCGRPGPRTGVRRRRIRDARQQRPGRRRPRGRPLVRRDRVRRRPCCAARGLRRRDGPPRRRGGLARPGCGRAGLGACARSRGGTPLARSAARSLARPRSPAADGSVPRLPVDARRR